MRVGIFDPYLDDIGGGEKYMLTIAQCLSQKHRVDIFWDNKKDVEKIIERFSLDLSKVNIVKNIFSSSFTAIKKYRETVKYDSIIFLSDGSIPLVFSKKLFVHFQQPFPEIRPSFKNSLKKMRVNSFFCNSLFTKSYIDKEFGIDSMVIYPPVYIKPKKQNKENIILHVGRFRVKDVTVTLNGEKKAVGDYKKQGVMVEAFKEMVGEGLKGWKLVLGVSINDNESKDFKNFVDSTKGFPVEFLVNKNNDSLWDVYSRAKIYWHASGFGEDLEKHPEFAEHFGISTVEAMGAGVVPIVINAGGQRETVDEGKNGFLWDSIFELKSKTLKLINDPELLDKLSKNARESAKKFGDDKFCEKVSEMIQ